MKIRIVIADDHPLILNALSIALMGVGIEVVATAANGMEAYEKIIQLRPDIALLDLKMPGKTGVDIARKLKKTNRSTRVILLSYFLEPYLFDQAEEIGLHGYLLKENPPEVIIQAVRKVASGAVFFDSRIVKEAQEHLHPLQQALATLTNTERKVLQLVASGFSTRQIAERAFVSIRTIDKHRTNIAAKLGTLLNGESLALWAKKNHELLQGK